MKVPIYAEADDLPFTYEFLTLRYCVLMPIIILELKKTIWQNIFSEHRLRIGNRGAKPSLMTFLFLKNIVNFMEFWGKKARLYKDMRIIYLSIIRKKIRLNKARCYKTNKTIQ
jgi:hypothetical protein